MHAGALFAGPQMCILKHEFAVFSKSVDQHKPFCKIIICFLELVASASFSLLSEWTHCFISGIIFTANVCSVGSLADTKQTTLERNVSSGCWREGLTAAFAYFPKGGEGEKQSFSCLVRVLQPFLVFQVTFVRSLVLSNEWSWAEASETL